MENNNERPEAIQALERIWNTLSEENKIKITAMVETVAMMKDYERTAKAVAV